MDNVNCYCVVLRNSIVVKVKTGELIVIEWSRSRIADTLPTSVAINSATQTIVITIIRTDSVSRIIDLVEMVNEIIGDDVLLFSCE